MSNPKRRRWWWWWWWRQRRRGLPQTVPDVLWPRVQLPPLLPQPSSGAPGHPPGIKRALCGCKGQAGMRGRGGGQDDTRVEEQGPPNPAPNPRSWRSLVPEPLEPTDFIPPPKLPASSRVQAAGTPPYSRTPSWGTYNFPGPLNPSQGTQQPAATFRSQMHIVPSTQL